MFFKHRLGTGDIKNHIEIVNVDYIYDEHYAEVTWQFIGSTDQFNTEIQLPEDLTPPDELDHADIIDDISSEAEGIR